MRRIFQSVLAGETIASIAKTRYEKRKAENRAFTARKKAGLLTPEELEAEEKRLAHNREWQKEWREKRKASEPEKPPSRGQSLVGGFDSNLYLPYNNDDI